jgi:hypothetical protein
MASAHSQIQVQKWWLLVKYWILQLGSLYWQIGSRKSSRILTTRIWSKIEISSSSWQHSWLLHFESRLESKKLILPWPMQFATLLHRITWHQEFRSHTRNLASDKGKPYWVFEYKRNHKQEIAWSQSMDLKISTWKCRLQIPEEICYLRVSNSWLLHLTSHSTALNFESTGIPLCRTL